MTIQTGNTAGERNVVEISTSSTFSASTTVRMVNVTDVTLTQSNNEAVYNTVDSLDTLKFATTSDRSLNFTALRDDVYDSDMETYYEDKTEVYVRYSPLGTDSTSPYKSGRAYVTQYDENKNGTNVYEKSVTLSINGGFPRGVHS